MVHHWINYNMETVRKLYTNDTPHHDGSNKMLEFTGVILVMNHKANLLDVDGDEVWIPLIILTNQRKGMKLILKFRNGLQRKRI